MKLKIYLAALLLAGFTFQSCSDAGDDNISKADLPTVVKQTFDNMFPGTTAKWEKERGMINAEFWNNGTETDVWFSADGTWIMTETDYNGAVPEGIKKYTDANYAGFVYDDIDYVQTPSGNYYDVELEKQGTKDVNLKIRENGELVK